MKMFLLALLSITSIASADAVIAKQSTNVYFAPPEMRGTHDIQILDNGVVQKVFYSTVPGAQPKIEKLATLEPKVVAAIIKLGMLVKEDQPKLTKPNLPGCMDAPSTYTRILNANQKLAVIHGHVACREETLADLDLMYEMRSITQIFEGLRALEIIAD